MVKSRRWLPREVRALLLVRTVNRLGAFSLGFLSLLLTRELGASLTTVGWLLAGFGVATIASRVLGGWLADHWGRRTTIILGLAGCAAAQIGLATATTTRQAGVAIVLLGLAFEVYEPACQGLLADSVAPDDRAAAFGLLGASLSLAALGAGALAAVLAPHGLRLLFAADAATCLAAGLLVVLLLRTGAGQHRDRSDVTEPPWRDRRLHRLFLTNVVFAVCYLQVLVCLPLTLADRGADPSTYGIVLAVGALVVIVAQPLLRIRSSRRSPAADAHRIPLVLGNLLLAAGFLGYAAASTPAAFVIATVVIGVAEVLLGGHLLAVVASLAPVNSRGRYLAVFGLSWGLAATVGPPFATLVLDQWGDASWWRLAAALCLGVAAAHATGIRRSRSVDLPHPI